MAPEANSRRTLAMSTLRERTGQANGADFPTGDRGVEFRGRGLRHGEQDVEVVDHEVEDDVDVQGARGEDAEAVGLEEHGVG